MVTIREDFILFRKITTARIDQIDTGQMVLICDHLGTLMLFDRHRIIGSTFHGRIVGNDHTFAPRDPADTGNDPGCRHTTSVHPQSSKLG